MPHQRLDWNEIEQLFTTWPGETCDLALELRDFVLQVAPELAETIAFNALCYSKPDQPYGVIGGNVCLIGLGGDRLRLGFIHGAFLPDPDGLLQGTGKSKRHIELRSVKDIRRQPFERLIRAAIAHQPGPSSQNRRIMPEGGRQFAGSGLGLYKRVSGVPDGPRLTDAGFAGSG